MTKTAPTTTGYYWAMLRSEPDFEPVHLVVTDGDPLVYVTGCEMPRDLDEVWEWGDAIVLAKPGEP